MTASNRERGRGMEIRIDALKGLGTEWQKNGMHRIYFNNLSKWYGLTCDYSGSGRINHAEINGETISNSKGLHIASKLSFGKIWFDVTTGKFSGQIDQEYFDVIVAAIRLAASN
jgi:hypothetical protein